MSPRSPVPSDKNPHPSPLEEPLAFVNPARREDRLAFNLDLIILAWVTVLVLAVVAQPRLHPAPAPEDLQSQARPHRNQNRLVVATRMDDAAAAVGATHRPDRQHRLAG